MARLARRRTAKALVPEPPIRPSLLHDEPNGTPRVLVPSSLPPIARSHQHRLPFPRAPRVRQILQLLPADPPLQVNPPRATYGHGCVDGDRQLRGNQPHDASSHADPRRAPGWLRSLDRGLRLARPEVDRNAAGTGMVGDRVALPDLPLLGAALVRTPRTNGLRTEAIGVGVRRRHFAVQWFALRDGLDRPTLVRVCDPPGGRLVGLGLAQSAAALRLPSRRNAPLPRLSASLLGTPLRPHHRDRPRVCPRPRDSRALARSRAPTTIFGYPLCFARIRAPGPDPARLQTPSPSTR